MRVAVTADGERQQWRKYEDETTPLGGWDWRGSRRGCREITPSALESDSFNLVPAVSPEPPPGALELDEDRENPHVLGAARSALGRAKHLDVDTAEVIVLGATHEVLVPVRAGRLQREVELAPLAGEVPDVDPGER